MIKEKIFKNSNFVTKPVVIRNDLIYEDLTNLINGEIAALRIPEFCSKDVCRIVSDKLLRHKNRDYFNKAIDIGCIGMAHFEIDGPEKFKYYHENAIPHTQELRDIFTPYLSPVDKIRLLLEEVWPSGANLEMLYGRKCFIGISRIMEPNIELLAHNDRLDRDSPDSIQAHSLITQLSACIYMQVPDEGGGLRLWMKEPKDENEYKFLKNNNYGISLEQIGSPMHVIEPEQGELLIFNARKYHGVAPGKGKPRINVGAFIGYRNDNSPLTYWS